MVLVLHGGCCLVQGGFRNISDGRTENKLEGVLINKSNVI